MYMCVCTSKGLRSYRVRFCVCGFGDMSGSTRSLMSFAEIQVEGYTTALGKRVHGM
jgi:hypothetical protein